jgi:hypothetical protein
MAEGIETSDGKPLDLDPAVEAEQNFARAMATPPDSDDKAPPKRGQRQSKPSGDADKPRVARSPGRPSKDAAKAVAGLSHEVRKQGMSGLAQLGAGLCAIVGNTSGQLAYKADAIVLASNADGIGEACAATADQDARFAAVVDKLCAAGPYAALIGVMVGVGTQVARNHGVDMPGTMAPEDILKAAEQQIDMAA